MQTDFPLPSADAYADSNKLCSVIAKEIRSAGGWIPFSRYMEMALYTPALGYYTGGSTKIGQNGDFVTAPSLTPLFARTLAVQLAELLPQTAGNIYEFGAGTGSLAAELLAALSDGIRSYCIIELSPELAERQKALLSASLPPELTAKAVWLSSLPDELDGIVVGNEVLDAMPCEIIKKDSGRFYRMGVGLENDVFTPLPYPLEPSPLLELAQLYFPDVEPYTSELHPVQHAFVRSIAGRLVRGAVLFADYGFDAALYYHPQRNTGTLLGHYRHHAVTDPFFLPGLTDLTAHVNFTDIAQAGTDGGLELIGYATQSAFLFNLGITGLLEQTAPAGSPAYLKEAAAVQQLVHPNEMGDKFKFIAFGRGIGTDWQGFAYGDICRKL